MRVFIGGSVRLLVIASAIVAETGACNNTSPAKTGGSSAQVSSPSNQTPTTKTHDASSSRDAIPAPAKAEKPLRPPRDIAVRVPRSAKSAFASAAPDIASAYKTFYEEHKGPDAAGKLEIIESLLERVPDHPALLSYAAEVLTGAGRHDEALNYLSRVARLKPPLPTCRKRSEQQKFKELLKNHCVGMNPGGGWLDSRGIYLCPPGMPGSREWNVTLAAAQFNIVSVSISKAKGATDPSPTDYCK